MTCIAPEFVVSISIGRPVERKYRAGTLILTIVENNLFFKMKKNLFCFHKKTQLCLNSIGQGCCFWGAPQGNFLAS